MKYYWILSKPRIVYMVLLTTWMGYWLAGGHDFIRLFWTLCGVGLCACSTGVLNQLFEVEQDRLMQRTCGRPLAQGHIQSRQALIFGSSCALLGLLTLGFFASWFCSALAVWTILAYLLAYTPLKRATPQSTWVGAASGATPPLIGWAAARGHLSPEAWALFVIQFLWQIPHFLAVFWIHRLDYARAGFKVMPVVDPTGRATACQIALHSLGLFLAGLLPMFLGMSRLAYGYGALLVGAAFLALGLKMSWTMSESDARRLFAGSLAYLPILFGMLCVWRL